MSAVYPVQNFTLRRLLRMQSHADKATTQQAERIALDALGQSHSGAYAADKARRFLRQASRLQSGTPPPSAA